MAFEIFLDALPPEKKKSRAKPDLANADLLPVRRDFAFLLDKGVPAGDVVKAPHLRRTSHSFLMLACLICSKAEHLPARARSRSPSR